MKYSLENYRKFIYVLLTLVGIAIIAILFYLSPEIIKKQVNINHNLTNPEMSSIQPLGNGVYAIENGQLFYYSSSMNSKAIEGDKPKLLAENLQLDNENVLKNLKKGLFSDKSVQLTFEPEAIIKLKDYYLIKANHLLVLDEKLNTKHVQEFKHGISGVFRNSSNTMEGIITLGQDEDFINSAVTIYNAKREEVFKLTLKDEIILGADYVNNEDLLICTTEYLYRFKNGQLDDKNPMQNTKGFDYNKPYIVRTGDRNIRIQNTDMETLLDTSVEEDIKGVFAKEGKVIVYSELVFHIFDGQELKTYRPEGNIKGVKKDGNRYYIITDKSVIEVE